MEQSYDVIVLGLAVGMDAVDGTASKAAPTAGPPGRDDETRAFLLDAALELFDVENFELVTTRRLAAMAGVNIAAIRHLFGSKRDPYRALLRQLVTDTEPNFGPAMADLEASLAAAGGNGTALASLLAEFSEAISRNAVPSDFMRWRSPLVFRE
ncbi:MAG: TetR family transcriptional regulator [Pseudomonadota bacterium]|nr:TetR family transcriptional regulator [Pseudomonadota bacterium]